MTDEIPNHHFAGHASLQPSTTRLNYDWIPEKRRYSGIFATCEAYQADALCLTGSFPPASRPPLTTGENPLNTTLTR